MSGTGGECEDPTREVPLDQPIRGVVPLDAVSALEGSYTQPLVWVDASDVPLPGVPEDEVTLTFTYDGAVALFSPCTGDGPQIDLYLDVTTRDHGPLGGGLAQVRFHGRPLGADGALGNFFAGNGEPTVSGWMNETAVGITVSGTLRTSSLPAPLGYARFPSMLTR